MTTPKENPLPSTDDLLRRARGKLSTQEEDELLSQILDTLARGNGDEAVARKLRQAFLLLVRNAPRSLGQEEVSNFLAHKIHPEDFDTLEWESPEAMLQFCDILYGFPFPTEEPIERIHNHVKLLLRQAFQYYEQQEDWEGLFLLLQNAPASPMMQDVELMRLRHLARVYEQQHIRKNRRWLYIYLAIQAVLVVVVFPFLFIYAENGAIQRQVEELADVKLGDEGYRLFSYMEGLYWSVITASSIGYGDITPLTTTGRIIAGILGTMGVVTIGVIAGLILKWITPRTID
ncbi:MAG: potassium channel family protein [Caldilineaceae bacterium]